MSERPIAPDEAPGLLESRLVHDGRIVRLSVDRVRFPDGSTGELEMVRHRGAAAVVPVLGPLDDPDPTVLLIRQYRYAADGYLYEVPAGLRDDADQSWDDCARRELEEETGWKPGVLLPLARLYTTPGFTDEVIHLYVAAELVEGQTRLDDDEFVEVVRVRLREALDWIRDGRVVDGKTVAALLFVSGFVLPPSGGPPRKAWAPPA